MFDKKHLVMAAEENVKQGWKKKHEEAKQENNKDGCLLGCSTV
jgi:hypothetical protein